MEPEGCAELFLGLFPQLMIVINASTMVIIRFMQISIYRYKVIHLGAVVQISRVQKRAETHTGAPKNTSRVQNRGKTHTGAKRQGLQARKAASAANPSPEGRDLGRG